MPVLVAALTALASWLGRLFMTGVVVAIGTYFSNAIFSMLGQVITLLSNVATGTSVSLPSVNTSFAGLPPEMLAFMKRIRIDDAFAIILSAVTVRAAASAFMWVRTLRSGAAP